MKISFDWDSTLSEERNQRLAEKFISNGHDVYITTSRHESLSRVINAQNLGWDNKIIFTISEKLGIPKENIRFTNGKDKWTLLEDFDIHFDDDQIEIELLEENTKCVGVLIFDP